jgi:hypothetical protein
MAAEFDTQPNHTDEDYQAPEPQRHDSGNTRGLWGTLAFLVLAAIVLLLLLTQCTARVPNAVGLSRSEAEAKLIRAGFTVGEVSELPIGSGKPGTVDEQAPLAGMTVRKGTSVDLIVATGGDLAVVPDVCGLSAANASVRLQQAGFDVEYAEEYSDTVPVGGAVSQSPSGGSRAGNGSLVSVYYSLGPQSAAAVNVSPSDTDDGLSESERDSTGSGSDPLIMTATQAYSGVTAWSSNGDIYVRLSPGGAARRVTSTGGWDTDPVIAPSHKYLVFLRAASSGKRATSVGAVSFTSFRTSMLSLPKSTAFDSQTPFYGKPIFAPSESSTTPNTDWVVLPQYWTEDRDRTGGAPSARLLVCNVPVSSAWVSWNLQFRPAKTLSLSRSSRAGCVRVTQKSGSNTVFSRDFNATTGLYPN